MPDILASIDDALADWEGEDGCAGRWQPPHAIPALDDWEWQVARQLCAITSSASATGGNGTSRRTPGSRPGRDRPRRPPSREPRRVQVRPHRAGKRDHLGADHSRPRRVSLLNLRQLLHLSPQLRRQREDADLGKRHQAGRIKQQERLSKTERGANALLQAYRR